VRIKNQIREFTEN